MTMAVEDEVGLIGAVNVAGVRAVVRAIEHDLGGWDQTRFLGTGDCGTSRCLAGWTVHLAGLDLAVMLRQEDGSELVMNTAASILGLDQDQADRLFVEFGMDGRRLTLADLKREITTVTGVTFP